MGHVDIYPFCNCYGCIYSGVLRCFFEVVFLIVSMSGTLDMDKESFFYFFLLLLLLLLRNERALECSSIYIYIYICVCV